VELKHYVEDFLAAIATPCDADSRAIAVTASQWSLSRWAGQRCISSYKRRCISSPCCSCISSSMRVSLKFRWYPWVFAVDPLFLQQATAVLLLLQAKHQIWLHSSCVGNNTDGTPEHTGNRGWSPGRAYWISHQHIEQVQMEFGEYRN